MTGKSGWIMKIDINKIYHADCMTMIPKMETDSIDLTLTDIPYGEVNRDTNGLRKLDKGVADVVTFNLDELVNELCRITKGSIYIFCGTEQVSEIRKCMVENGMSTRLCIWEKTNPSPQNGEHIWLSGVECCVFGKFSGASFNEFCKNSVFRYPSGSSTRHPTEKPLPLIKKLIMASSNVGDVVFDPFVGSGTTTIGAVQLGRKYIGIEKDEKYFNIALKRTQEEEAQEMFLYEPITPKKQKQASFLESV